MQRELEGMERVSEKLTLISFRTIPLSAGLQCELVVLNANSFT